MDWVDQKFVNLLSNRVQLFKRVNANLYNMRCIVCGDSKKNKVKARGYIMGDKDKTSYFCHNCGASMSLKSFLKQVDPLLAVQYSQDKFLERQSDAAVSQTARPKPDISVVEKPKYAASMGDLKKISQLPPSHPAKKYIEGRKIPAKFHYKIYYAPEFEKWVNSIIPEKLDESHSSPRIVFPFITRDNRLVGFTGRALDPADTLRYISIMVDPEGPKMFGLEMVDFAKTIYVTEGPIDSMFVDNCIAMGGSDMDKAFKQLKVNPRKVVIIYDNEPRNSEIVARMQKSIDKGFNIFVWPSKIETKDLNDLNDLVMAGKSILDVKKMIEQNTSYGIEAQMKLNDWKRV